MRDNLYGKIEAIEYAANKILFGEVDSAVTVINERYPFHHLDSTRRKNTDKEKITQFVKDGFIDRYSGDKLVNPGILKILSFYMPTVFPYHPHWKM